MPAVRGRTRIPMDPLHHVGHVQRRRDGRTSGCAGGSRSRGAGARPRRGPCPCRTCQQTMSVTRERALDQRPHRVALVHVLPPARSLGPGGPPASYCCLDGGDLLVGCRDASSTTSSFLRLAGLGSLGARPSAVLRRQDAVLVAGRPAPVHSWTARSANCSACPAPRPGRCDAKCAGRGGAGTHHSRALAGVEGVHPSQRIALHEVAVLWRHLAHLVLADERVTADERRRGDEPAPDALSRVAPRRTTAGCRPRRPPRPVGTRRRPAARSAARRDGARGCRCAGATERCLLR